MRGRMQQARVDRPFAVEMDIDDEVRVAQAGNEPVELREVLVRVDQEYLLHGSPLAAGRMGNR